MRDPTIWTNDVPPELNSAVSPTRPLVPPPTPPCSPPLCLLLTATLVQLADHLCAGADNVLVTRISTISFGYTPPSAQFFANQHLERHTRHRCGASLLIGHAPREVVPQPGRRQARCCRPQRQGRKPPVLNKDASHSESDWWCPISRLQGRCRADVGTIASPSCGEHCSHGTFRSLISSSSGPGHYMVFLGRVALEHRLMKLLLLAPVALIRSRIFAPISS